MNKLIGTFNPKKSWEKQSVFKLENGCEITTGYNPHYGEMITRIDDQSGYWHCSNGLQTLPERFSFALEWIQTVNQTAQTTIMRPSFTKKFN